MEKSAAPAATALAGTSRRLGALLPRYHRPMAAEGDVERSALVRLVLGVALAVSGCGGGDDGGDDTAPTVAATPAGGVFGSPVAVTLTASDDSGIIYYTVDGSTPEPGAAATFEGGSSIADIDLPEAETTIRFMAMDEAGNRGDAASETYLVDLTAPEVATDPGTPGPVGLLAEVTVRFSIDEAVHFTVELGGDGAVGSGMALAEGDAAAGDDVPVSVPGYQLSYLQATPLTLYATDVAGHAGSASVDLALQPPLAIDAAGALYGQVLIEPAGTRAFVADTDGDDIDVIDLERTSPTFHTVIASVPVGTGPRAMALTPAGDRLYVCNSDADTISVVDTESLEVSTTFAAADEPGGIAVSSADLRAYYTGWDGTVRIIDVDPVSDDYNEQVGQLTPEALLLTGQVAVSSDGRRLLLSWNGSSAAGTDVIDIDPDGGSYGAVVSRPLPAVASTMHGVALAPGGTTAYSYVVADTTVELGRVDLATGAVLAHTTDVDPSYALAATPDESVLLGCDFGQLHLVDTADMTSIADLALPEGVELGLSCAVTPDGRELYSPSSGGGDTWVLPLR